MTLIKLPKRSIRPLSIDAEERSQLQTIGKRIIPRRPDCAPFGARRNAQIIERKIMLLIQANRGLGAILLSVKQPEELPVIFPIPAGIADVHEAFLFDLAGDLAERWESVRRWRTFWPKLFFLRKPERTNARKNFQPREKKPTHCGGETPDPASELGRIAGNLPNPSRHRRRARSLPLRSRG